MDSFIPIKTDTIYIVTHAEAEAGTLTKDGTAAAEALTDRLDPYEIDGIFCSPAPVVLATIEPFAIAKSLTIATMPDLRDHSLSLQGNRPDDPFARTRFDNRAKAPPGGEPFHAAASRLRDAIGAIARRPVRAPVLATHPGILAAFLSQRDSSFGYEAYLDMPAPGLWKLTHDMGSTTKIDAL